MPSGKYRIAENWEVTMYNYTISCKYRTHYQFSTYACIEMPNGMKCNPAFWRYCIHNGILTWDD